MSWAKRAAEEIVSDDVIDEADAEKSSSQDWLKWALAATALGAAGFAAWRYSPEIKAALKSTKLIDNRGLSNRAIEQVPGVGALSSSPTAWGAAVGAAGQVPFMPAAVRESVALGGKDAPLRTISGQLGHAAVAGKPVSGGWGVDRANSALAEDINRGLGGPDAVAALTKLHNAGVKDPAAALSKLRTLDFNKLPTDWATHKGQQLASDTGLSRGAAATDFDRLTANTTELGRRLSSTIDYQVPREVPQLDAAGKPVLDPTGKPVMTSQLTPVQRKLIEVPDAERMHLAPEHRVVWDAHRQAAREAGVPDAMKFDIGGLGSSLSTNRATLRRGFTVPHAARSAGIGAAVGGGLGLAVDAAGEAMGY